MECDFCSSPEVVTRYQCLDFDSASEDAGVLHRPVGLDPRPVNVILKSKSYWAACQPCSEYVDRDDLEGLLKHVCRSFMAHYGRLAHGVEDHLRMTYQLFFKNRIRVAEVSNGEKHGL